MIRNIFLSIFIFTSFYGIDLNDFDVRQNKLQDVRKIIQSEESIARAYEQYILNNYSLPSNMTQLYTTNYLGNSSDFLGIIKSFDSSFNNFSLGLSKLSYSLKDYLKEDVGIKSLYEDNSYRKRTYYLKNKNEIYIILQDEFAKHLFDLIQQKGSGLSSCNGVANISCIKNNHIYIKPTYVLLEITDYLMAYQIDNFKTGPIIITSDSNLHSSIEFNSILKGTELIDTEGNKYVKTKSGIEILK